MGVATLILRGLAVGLVAGTVGASAWVGIVYWLDHTEWGRAFCYARAMREVPERFQDAGSKVSWDEGARLGRPSAAGLGLQLVVAFLAIAVITAVSWVIRRRRAAQEATGKEWRLWQSGAIAVAALVGTAIPVVVALAIAA